MQPQSAEHAQHLRPAPQRPHFHYTPGSGWLNDPNGLIFYEGEYHLFYQHHPASTVWGPMHWGHAVSRDLLTWEELPIALAPDDLGLIFSGSVVIDWDNTAGFGAKAMVAVFTHAAKDQQMQSLAYSHDRGRTWTKYSGNPVLLPPADHKDFRDPRVFWYDDGTQAHWVMALAVAREIWFYRSANLKDWSECSRFGAHAGSHGGVWECPELIQLTVEGTDEKRWVLVVSVGNGAPAGGSGVQYFVGQFDGVTFHSHDAPEQVRWVDWGADFYATQAWTDAPGGRKLWLAWMNNWTYANQIPDTGGWRGSMSVPREVLLRHDGPDLVLVQHPVSELARWRVPQTEWRARKLDREIIWLDQPCSSAHEIRVIFRVDADTTASYFGLRVRGTADAATVIGYHVQHGQLVIKRDTAEPHVAPLRPRDGQISLHILLDQASVEVFADEGRVVMTEQIFSEPDAVGLAVFADGGAVKLESLVINGLDTV